MLILQQLCDALINGAAYILTVIVGSSSYNSIFTNFNFFTLVSSTENPFLNIVMQGMAGDGTGWGAFFYRIAFMLFGVLAAIQIFKAFINPSSRGNASPVRTVLWIIFAGFLMIYGQAILSSILGWFTTLMQGNMKSLFNLSNLDEEANLIKWSDALANLNHLNRYGAAMICAAGVGGSLLRAVISYLERYLSFAVTCYMEPFAMAMSVCDDTRRSTTQWVQSVASQMIGLVLSLIFLYMGAQALVASDGFLGLTNETLNGFERALGNNSNGVLELQRVIIKSVGATAFFSLSWGSEKFLSAFGIQTMHIGDTAQAVASGSRLAMAAATTGLRLDKEIGSKGLGIAARGGVLNRLKFSSDKVAAPGLGGALKRGHNAVMDGVTKHYGGVTGTGGITRKANGKLSFAIPNGATPQDKKILDGLNKGLIQNAIAQGGLQKKADGSPVNAKAAKTLKDYGVNNANDLARAMYGDKAFKNGESYQMASMLRGDKTGGQYLVLSGVDQNGNLITKAPRVPDRVTSTLSEQTQKALGESDKAYSNAEKQRNNTVARDPREKALMDAGYKDGYAGLAHSMLGEEESSKFSSIDSVSLDSNGTLTFTGKDKDGTNLTSTVDTMGSSTAFAPNGEKLVNAEGQAVADIDARGNVAPYNVSGGGFDLSNVTYEPSSEQRTAFAGPDVNGNNVVPELGANPQTLVQSPDKVDEYLAGFTYDAKHNQFHGYATFDDVAINLDAPAEERRAHTGKVDINVDELRHVPDDSLEGVACGTLTKQDGTQQTVYVRSVDGDYVFSTGDHRDKTTNLHAVTADEYENLNDEAHAEQNDKANRRKDKRNHSEDSDDA